MIANQEVDAHLETLCTDADPRKARSLRLIHAICLEQHERGSNDFSVATIGRLSAERGGPAAGAIRNKTGEAYRALISAFARSVSAKSSNVRATDHDHIDLILEGVTDPLLRTRLGLLLAELKATRAQLLAARHLANQTATLDLASASLDQPPPASPNFSALEIRALQNAISEATLAHWGWRADASGRIVSDTGSTVFAAGFVTAITKMLEGGRSEAA